MRKSLKRVLCFLLCAAFFLTSISDVAVVRAEAGVDEAVVETGIDALNASSSPNISTSNGTNVNRGYISVVKNGTITLYADQTVTWTVGDAQRVAIEGVGFGINSFQGDSITLKGIGSGSSNVTINVKNSSGNTNYCYLYVYDEITTTDSLTVKQFAKSTISFNSLSGYSYAYFISDTSKAEITSKSGNNVYIKGLAVGQTTLTVVAYDRNTVEISRKDFIISVEEYPFSLYTDSSLKNEITNTLNKSTSSSYFYLYYDKNVFLVNSESDIVVSNTNVVSVDSVSSYYGRIEMDVEGAGDATITVTNTYGQTYTVAVHVDVPISSVHFVNDDDINVFRGWTHKANVTVNPSNATYKPIFKSSNISVCTVDEDGNVTAVGAGSAKISVFTSESDSYADDYFWVNVSEPYIYFDCASIFIGSSTTVFGIGGNVVSCESLNPAVAVANGCAVTGVGAGQAEIVATLDTGVKVSAIVDVYSPYLGTTSLTLNVAKSETLYVYGGSGTISWSSSNSKIATVNSNGKVTAKKKGKCTIYAVVNGVTLSCAVTVKDPELSKKKLTIGVAASSKLTVNGGTGKITWSSSNTKVATVDKNGKVTAKSKGKCTISAKRNGKTLKCEVKVVANTWSQKVVTRPSYYNSYTDGFLLSKLSYESDGSLTVEGYVVNTHMFNMNYFNYVYIEIYDKDGKYITKYKTPKIKKKCKSYSVTKISFKVPKKKVKRVTDLKNDYYGGYYWEYKYSYSY